jgi:hypothetical protein
LQASKKRPRWCAEAQLFCEDQTLYESRKPDVAGQGQHGINIG